MRYFSANKEKLAAAKTHFPLHPRQPVNLRATLSAELQTKP
jgi:hypothetical protein